MYKVQMFLKGKELETKQLYKTKAEVIEVMRLYKIYHKSIGTRNFTFRIAKTDDDGNIIEIYD